jgi:hypothetical protein
MGSLELFARAGPEPQFSQSPLLSGWDYRIEPPCSAENGIFKKSPEFVLSVDTTEVNLDAITDNFPRIWVKGSQISAISLKMCPVVKQRQVCVGALQKIADFAGSLRCLFVARRPKQLPLIPDVISQKLCEVSFTKSAL